MKILLPLFLLVSFSAQAQKDSVKSRVYNWSDSLKKENPKERKVLFNGSTLDLSNIRIHTSTLAPGQTNHSPVSHNDFEEVLIVKEGNLKVTLDSSSKEIGPGGIALITAGSMQSFQNISTKPATYFVIRFISKSPVNVKRGVEAGGPVIKDWKELQVKKTDKGESRPVFDRATAMFKRLEIHATTLNPGFASHAPHTHREEELTFLIAGAGEMQVDQLFEKATAGDVVFAEANVLHAFKNTSDQPTTYYAIKWED